VVYVFAIDVLGLGRGGGTGFATGGIFLFEAAEFETVLDFGYETHFEGSECGDQSISLLGRGGCGRLAFAKLIKKRLRRIAFDAREASEISEMSRRTRRELRRLRSYIRGHLYMSWDVPSFALRVARDHDPSSV
jgi:hypothetical protein